MQDEDKIKEQLIEELQELRNRTTQLEQENQTLRQFMESATDAFYVFDSNLNFVDLNKKAEELVGKSREEANLP